MRRLGIFLLFVLVLSLGVLPAFAQDKAINYGDVVEGKLTASAIENKFTFSGKAGDIVMGQIMPKPGTFDLDPQITLADSAGNVLATNDDFSYPVSVVVVELASDATYTLIAGRSGGAEGSSEGDYVLSLTKVDLMQPGGSLEATIYSDTDKSSVHLAVLRPTADTTLTIGFSQTPSDLVASLELVQWSADDIETRLLSMDGSEGVSKASFSVEVKGGNFYLLVINRALLSFSFDTTEAKIGVTVN